MGSKSNYVLSCGSTVDLTEERLKERNIEYISYKYYVDGKEYIDNFGKSMSHADFYAGMRNGRDTKTTQINAAEYAEYFEKFLKQGLDVVHLEMSSGISGSFNSAQIAKRELNQKYKNNKVYLVDSLCISSGYGLFVEEVADLRDKGISAEALALEAEKLKIHIGHLCMSSDLTFFIKGGRISKAAGAFGTLLRICPCMYADDDGRLVVFKKIPGKKRTMEDFIKIMSNKAIDGTNYNGRCYICNSDCREDAEMMKTLIEAKFPNLVGKIEIYNLGPPIGSHTGPGTVAVFYKATDRHL